MRRFKFGKIFVVVAALFLLGACAGRAETGGPALDFSLTDTSFNTVKLSDYKGKVVILNFFATWCPPCRGEIPDFIDLQREYGDKIAFIGVSNESAGILKDFGARLGINYTLLEDKSRQAFSKYGPIRGVPTTFIIGKDFKIRKIYIGARPREIVESDIKELLAQ